MTPTTRVPKTRAQLVSSSTGRRAVGWLLTAAWAERRGGRTVHPLQEQTPPARKTNCSTLHAQIVKKIAARQALVSGEDGAKLAQTAIAAGIAAINAHTERLSQNASKKAARQAVIEQIPNDDDILAGLNIQIENSGPTIHAAHKKTLDAAVAGGDCEAVLKACPVRESDALESISSTLGFKKRWEYERAVRHLLTEGDDSLQFVRDLFEGLATEVLASSKTPAGSSMESRSAAAN